MPDIVTLGQKTHYKDDCFAPPYGPKPQTILIQHGFGRNSNFWWEFVPALSAKYRVIRRDARGHGESSAPDRSTYDWGLDTMLKEIIDMLDQLGIDKVHFLGESTSGMLGMALAAKYPERLYSLIICSSPTYLPPAASTFFSMGMASWQEAIRTLGSEGWARALSKLPGTVAAGGDFVEWWAKEVGRSPAYGLEQYATFLENDLDGRKYQDSYFDSCANALYGCSCAVQPYAVKSLMLVIKSRCMNRSRARKSCLSTVQDMRSTSTRRLRS